MYVIHNIEVCSCNHCCSGEAVSTTHSECVLVALGPPGNAQGPYLHMCPARLYNIFPHYLINGATLKKKVNYWQ